jgi:hypothetical protein
MHNGGFEPLRKAIFPMDDMYRVINNIPSQDFSVRISNEVRDMESENNDLKRRLGEIKATMLVNFGKEGSTQYKVLDGSEKTELEMVIKVLTHMDKIIQDLEPKQ